MTPSNYQARRATIDDLAALRKLWIQARFPASDFEKRLTDFQVAETADGQVLGGIGLEIEQRQGKIYGEVYAHPELATELRRRLWDRLLTRARQYRLSRLWIESGCGMFWLEQGFELAGTQMVAKVPPAFGMPAAGWLALQLLDEEAIERSLEPEMELLRLSQQARNQRVTRQVLALRVLAGAIVALVFILAAWAGWHVFGRLGTAPFR